MNTDIKVDGKFLRYGDTVLSRACVAEANLNNGHILMNYGHCYILPPEVVKAWFSDQIDYADEKVRAALAGGGNAN